MIRIHMRHASFVCDMTLPYETSTLVIQTHVVPGRIHMRHDLSIWYMTHRYETSKLAIRTHVVQGGEDS